MTLFDDNEQFDQLDRRPKRSRARILSGISFLALFLVATLGLQFLPRPYVIEQPGPVTNVLGTSDGLRVININGAKTYPATGSLDLLTVSVVGNREQTPSWLQLFSAWIDPAAIILPLDEVFPPNVSSAQDEAESRAMMEESQQDAIYVALTELGYEIPSHLYVSEVTKNSPSAKILKATDFIESVNGQSVGSVEELRAAIAKFAPDGAVTIGYTRDSKKETAKITAVKDDTGKYRIGIMVGTKFDFPITVNLQLANVGGPSGGMMFALGIYDSLTPGALTGGKQIAGTGTIDLAGQVGPIGGIRQKLYGAKKAGARYFLAPKENCSEVNGHIPSNMQVFRVSNFDDAVNVVEKIGSGANLSTLPTCSSN